MQETLVNVVVTVVVIAVLLIKKEMSHKGVARTYWIVYGSSKSMISSARIRGS